MFDIDINPAGKEFQAKVRAHATAIPFSTLSINVGDVKLTVYAKADDALKLIRVATLLNEVFASETIHVEAE